MARKSRKQAVVSMPAPSLYVHAAITAQTKQIQSDYEAKLKQREIVREVGSADTLTQALIDRLISKVYIFPGNRIEIEYVTQDFLGIDESGKEA